MTKPPWDSWYKTARWQRRRAQQLRKEPLCWRCLEEGRTTPATVANHTTPHKGDPELFWRGPLDSQCKPHHDSTQQSIEKGGEGRKPKATIGLDGWPA